MSKSNTLFIIALLLGAGSCYNNQDCCLPSGEMEGLIGKWQIYEHGYSPGGGYIVKEVPNEPAQILTFESDNQFWSKNAGMDGFSYYLIINDRSEGNILALYEEEPDIKENQDTKSLAHSYMITYDKGNVKLSFRYCIEGCHIGLKRIK